MSFHHLSGGLWGIMRVYDRPGTAAWLEPDALRDVDDPAQPGYRPLVRLEMAQVTARVFDDADVSGDRGDGEAVVAGVTPLANSGAE